MEYLKIILDAALQENAEVKYAWENGSLKMIGHENPLSIRENEFKFIRNFIIEHNLRRGYEVATAFGVSAIAAGLGFKETGGHLVTMDAYIEEQYNNCAAYRNRKETYYDADGFKSTEFLRKYFELEDIIDLCVGWSPDDTVGMLDFYYPATTISKGETRGLDYVFIDAMHYDEAVIADIESVRPFLADKFVLFLHDVHCFGYPVKNYLMDTFGQMWVTPESCKLEHKGGYNLSYISNL
jgi:predicted O-methyltransferase YrrM